MYRLNALSVLCPLIAILNVLGFPEEIRLYKMILGKYRRLSGILWLNFFNHLISMLVSNLHEPGYAGEPNYFYHTFKALPQLTKEKKPAYFVYFSSDFAEHMIMHCISSGVVSRLLRITIIITLFPFG